MPSTALAAILTLALVPGWVFLQRRRRHTPSAPIQGIDQLLQVGAAGLATTGVAALVLLLLPLGRLPFLVDVDEWSRSGDPYLGTHPRQVIFSTMLLLSL